MNKKVVLVYSGGLDTSICIPMMREEYGYDEVITVTVDVGQSRSDIAQAEDKARRLGTTHFTVEATEEFAREYCFAALKANGDYQGYPMSTSIARPLIAKKAAEVAIQLGANSFAHGCTGKGNDQFRIEFGLRSRLPSAKIHAPIRERNLTRSWEIEYALAKGIPIEQSVQKIWSVDENLWGRSIEGGRLEDPDFSPPEEIFTWTKSTIPLEDSTRELAIDFVAGEPTALDGVPLTAATLIARLNALAGGLSIGRIDIMEDRLLGLKVRENYECPAATVLLTAHRALEALVLTREERRFKTLVDQEWSRLAYEGLWWDPLKEALEAFINTTQKRVTGTVRLRLQPRTVQVLGRKSRWAIYSEEMASFDSQVWDQNQATGMVQSFGLQSQFFTVLRERLAES